MYIGLSFFSIHHQNMFFWISNGHKNYRDNQIVARNRCCLWPLKYTFKPVCTTFQITRSKLQNLLWMKLATDLTFTFSWKLTLLRVNLRKYSLSQKTSVQRKVHSLFWAPEFRCTFWYIGLKIPLDNSLFG